MRPYELNRGDTVFWTTRALGSGVRMGLTGTVQDIIGHYANVRLSDRVLTVEIKLLRKTP